MLFSKSACVQCTRRLARLAQSSESSNNPTLGPITPQLSHRHRSPLVTRSPYSTVSGKRVAKVTTRESFTKVRFKYADVPPREFWVTQARAPLVTDLGADECLQAAQAYVNAALQGASGWRERLITLSENSTAQSYVGKGKGKGKTVSAYALHYVAVMIVMAQRGPAGHLAMHILHTLADLDYAPSVLTMVRMALQRRLLGQPQFEPAFEGLERILRHIGDGSTSTSSSKGSKGDLAADACTLRALIYAAENTHEGDNNALRWFRRAYEIGAAASGSVTEPTPSTAEWAHLEGRRENEADTDRDLEGVEGARFDPHWQWKISFALGVAAIRMKRGEMEKARDMYTVASFELDSAAGYFGLATVLEQIGETDTDRYVECLEKAAVSGVQDAARTMGTREWDRAGEAGLNAWEEKKRRVIAEEWMSIAGFTAPTKI